MTASGTGARPSALDLLYISDSSGWQVAEAYRALAEQASGQPVRLVDWRAPGLSMLAARDRIKAEADVVARADIVVLWGNPLGSGVPDSSESCMTGTGTPGRDTASDWTPFRDLTGQVLDSIWAARRDQQTVVRVTDLYSGSKQDWTTRGVFDACTSIWELMSQAMRQAAAGHGARMISAYDALNGTQHDQDPLDAGYLSGDRTHLSPAGGRVVARALAATGFEPTPAP